MAGPARVLAVPKKRLAAAAAGDPLAVEAWLRAAGYARVAGVDEAGVGSLAGPVVVAAAVLHRGGGPGGRLDLSGVRDSKVMSAAARAAVVARLPPSTDVAAGAAAPLTLMGRWALGSNDVKVVTYLPAADRLAVAVSLASILATHTRDALMVEAEAGWPGYGFGTHRGHPTRAHLSALAARGPCAIHR
ncbi:hypothetical protein I4F81_010751 [Pyropia yezoensis]|uniref:Uncharacterized protein n=1 Tax=Pyropia yezoensis TaxID=2788 RepID=A0ACC3CEI3_PYRYE|nr:hypothetical protein I4F81_010751 [Neopyropia yezoensis]